MDSCIGLVLGLIGGVALGMICMCLAMIGYDWL